MKGLLGKAEAVLELTQDSAAELKRSTAELSTATARVYQAGQQIDRLSDAVAELREIVAGLQTTDWLTTTQLAAEMSVDDATVRRWYREGKIRGHRSGDTGHIRFDRREVREDIAKW